MKFPLRVALFMAMLLSIGAPAFAQQTEAPSIAAIHARLYHERTGEFSGDVLSGGDVSLWNTIIGEGAAGAPSNFTLVTVEVRGRHLPIGSVRIRLSATDERGRSLGRRTIPVSIYDESATFFAPLFLHDTGCSPITISARLVGEGVDPSPMERTIPFACGE